jgi:hypothetical protein
LDDLTKALLGMVRGTTVLVPCIILTIAPMTVTLNGATIPGVKGAGLTYTVGAPAIAIWCPPAAPLIWPTA